jgi:hypothetical protein
MREIPRELWAEVLEVTRDIVWEPEQDGAEVTSANMERLRAIYARQNALGQPNPLLTEILADFTDDAAEAVALYRIALAQSNPPIRSAFALPPDSLRSAISPARPQS